MFLIVDKTVNLVNSALQEGRPHSLNCHPRTPGQCTAPPAPLPPPQSRNRLRFPRYGHLTQR